MTVAIIGGGPAGLNAALVLARAKHRVLLFDSGNPRNAVTRKMHGFITREGVAPAQFRRLAHQELSLFPGVRRYRTTIQYIERLADGSFTLTTNGGKRIKAHQILLATGLKEALPNVPNISRYYGRSLFSCPYCDGYELIDRPLAIITEGRNAVSLAATISQWSDKLHLFTNGKVNLSSEEVQMLRQMGVKLHTSPITALVGKQGKLSAIVTADGERVRCSGGFISPCWQHAGLLAQQLGCKLAAHGGIWQDGRGRSSVAGVYVAGDVSNVSPAQAVLAAGDGVRAAISLNQDIIQGRLNAHAADIRGFGSPPPSSR